VHRVSLRFNVASWLMALTTGTFQDMPVKTIMATSITTKTTLVSC
jgi:hypothetical protein